MNAVIVESFAKPPRYGIGLPIRWRRRVRVLLTVEAAGLHPIVKSLANGSHYGSTGELAVCSRAWMAWAGWRMGRGCTSACRGPLFGTFAERAVTKPRCRCGCRTGWTR